MITSILCIDADAYARDMNLLRHSRGEAYGHIIAGRLGSALELARSDVSSTTGERVRRAVATAANLFVALTALDKADALRTLATRPLGDIHLRTAPWPVLSRIVDESLIEPAQLVLDYGDTAKRTDVARLDGKGERTIAYLRSKKLLPCGDIGQCIADIAKTLENRLPEEGYDALSVTRRSLDRAIRLATPLAHDSSEPGWSRSSFVDFRIGLTTIESALFLARETLMAIARVDTIVFGRNPAPLQLQPTEPPVTKVRVLAEMLRSIAGTDSAVSNNPAPCNKNGQGASDSMITKTKAVDTAGRAARLFAIDTGFWFAR